ncbi:MAG TPA: class I SAM-dependent methyltransferase [Geobacteraceae bacterium]
MIVDNDLVHGKCPLCSSESIRRLGDIAYCRPLVFSSGEIALKNEPELWKCANCRSGFTQYAVPEKAAAELYGAGAGGERWISKPFAEEKPKEVIQELEKILLPGRRVLDVGCNTGEMLDFARNRHCLTTGVDYSMASVGIVREKGHNCFLTLEEAKGEYDVITAFDLVEHLHDISSFLGACRDKLRDKGLLVILTGNISCFSARISGADWWYVRFPEHIIFPSMHYFCSLPHFSVAKWRRTYAAVKFLAPLRDRIRSLLKGIQHGDYAGIPSIGPDHELVVLRKCVNA